MCLDWTSAGQPRDSETARRRSTLLSVRVVTRYTYSNRIFYDNSSQRCVFIEFMAGCNFRHNEQSRGDLLDQLFLSIDVIDGGQHKLLYRFVNLKN